MIVSSGASSAARDRVQTGAFVTGRTTVGVTLGAMAVAETVAVGLGIAVSVGAGVLVGDGGTVALALAVAVAVAVGVALGTMVSVGKAVAAIVGVLPKAAGNKATVNCR